MSADKAAVVTGGAGGIGRALLARLRRDGFRPVSWDLSGDVTEADLAIGVDVTDDRALERAVRKTLRQVGPIGARERRADLLARIPLGRFSDPEEVAAMVSWLCSPECSFSTGAVFDLSGGRSTS
jgi:NAD(P)-dependent dehydrogenase (short-subunit alcohol dehydrogenase family)